MWTPLEGKCGLRSASGDVVRPSTREEAEGSHLASQLLAGAVRRPREGLRYSGSGEGPDDLSIQPLEG